MNTTSVEAYLRDGCGRCDLYKTPQCRVHSWATVLSELRTILRAAGLAEELKWGSPCYTVDGKNVALLAARRDACTLSFFKGILLDDPHGLLERPGPNTHQSRLIRLSSLEQVRTLRPALAQYLAQAIAVEQAGTPIPAALRPPEALPDALQALLDADPGLLAAFEALTPGRQRSYILHISAAKQAGTQAARAERCIPRILAGKGFNER